MHTTSDSSAPRSGASSARDSTGRRRRQWTDDDRIAYLALLAESGMSLAEFSRAMDVPEATLHLWRTQARGEGSASDARGRGGEASPALAAVEFATVHVVDAPTAVVPRPALPTPMGLTLTMRWPNGLETRLTGVEPTTLAPLLQALAAIGG